MHLPANRHQDGPWSGTREDLVAARRLIGAPGITADSGAEAVEYWHFLCSGHELVWSNGAVTGTLYTGTEALKTFAPDAKTAIFPLFPELAQAPNIPPPGCSVSAER